VLVILYKIANWTAVSCKILYRVNCRCTRHVLHKTRFVQKRSNIRF